MKPIPSLRRAFLARLGEQDHVAVEGHVLPLEQQHGHHRRRQVVLVVDGAAPVDEAAVAGGAEGRKLPFRRIHRHGVEMTEQQERALAAVALEPRHHVGPLGILGQDLRRDAVLVEQPLQVFGLGAFGGAGVEADQRLVVAERLGLDRRPVWLGRLALRGERGDQAGGERGRQPRPALDNGRCGVMADTLTAHRTQGRSFSSASRRL